MGHPRKEDGSTPGSGDGGGLDRRTLDTLRSVANGAFESRVEDLRAGRLKRVARIDQDHMSRGLYATSSRLGFRQEAFREHLRDVLEARIQSVADALEQAGHVFDQKLLAFVEREIDRICESSRNDMLDEMRVEAAKSGAAEHLLASFEPAVVRDVKLERTRALRTLQTAVGVRELQQREQDKESESFTTKGRGNQFVRTGEAWRIRYDGNEKPVRHRLGIEYLSILIANQGVPVSVADLVQKSRGLIEPQQSQQPMMDAEATHRARRVLVDLKVELDEAKQNNDLGRQETLARAIDEIEEQVKSAAGLRGKSRAFSRRNDKLRGQVGHALDVAIRAIGAEIPVLGKHFADSVRRRHGGSPCYRPSAPVAWELGSSERRDP